MPMLDICCCQCVCGGVRERLRGVKRMFLVRHARSTLVLQYPQLLDIVSNSSYPATRHRHGIAPAGQGPSCSAGGLASASHSAQATCDEQGIPRPRHWQAPHALVPSCPRTKPQPRPWQGLMRVRKDRQGAEQASRAATRRPPPCSQAPGLGRRPCADRWSDSLEDAPPRRSCSCANTSRRKACQGVCTCLGRHSRSHTCHTGYRTTKPQPGFVTQAGCACS